MTTPMSEQDTFVFMNMSNKDTYPSLTVKQTSFANDRANKRYPINTETLINRTFADFVKSLSDTQLRRFLTELRRVKYLYTTSHASKYDGINVDAITPQPISESIINFVHSCSSIKFSAKISFVREHRIEEQAIPRDAIKKVISCNRNKYDKHSYKGSLLEATAEVNNYLGYQALTVATIDADTTINFVREENINKKQTMYQTMISDDIFTHNAATNSHLLNLIISEIVRRYSYSIDDNISGVRYLTEQVKDITANTDQYDLFKRSLNINTSEKTQLSDYTN